DVFLGGEKASCFPFDDRLLIDADRVSELAGRAAERASQGFEFVGAHRGGAYSEKKRRRGATRRAGVRWRAVEKSRAKLRPLVFSGAFLCVACKTPLPGRPELAGGGDDVADAHGLPRLRFDPPATADAVAPITQITIELVDTLSDPRVILVAGALSASQLRDFARPVVPQTLASRAITAMAWADRGRSVVVVAPLTSLEPGSL